MKMESCTLTNQPGAPGYPVTAENKQQRKRLLNKKTILECLWRNSSEAMLHPCDGHNPSQPDESLRDAGLLLPGDAVRIQFVYPLYKKEEDTSRLDSDVKKSEQHSSKSDRGQERTSSSKAKIFQTDKNIQRAQSSGTKFASRKGPGNLPSQVDAAHVLASATMNHTELRSASRMTTILPHQSPDAVAKELPRLLGNSNPILILSDPRKKKSSESDMKRQRTSPTKDDHHSHSLRRDTLAPPEKRMIRKIPMNPYIAASKDERWTDPQTGLVYRTDLCQYLGHERKDVGRHTLTGVGQYTKTMLNIKVYGVGFYVSKRDILADPSMENFASLSSEELRNSPEFFETLRKMDGFAASADRAGSFDRTLFLKTNMQLATETMRSSLDADWKMLTPEAKEMLIGSSMKARPATEETLRIIESPDNPNRCSCAQIAPEEYEADPSCCARGTELVFTWRKDGSLEIRLNGNFMDSFPRPDIAEGIFFEYLRMDNPMSVDFLSNVVEGFPFLLAPLSQVKGVASPVVSQHFAQHDPSLAANPLVRTIGGFGEVLSSQAAGFADFIQNGAHELSSNAMERAKSVGSAARNLGEELERKRELIGKHVSAFSSRAMSSFYQTDEEKMLAVAFDWISDAELSKISGKLHEEQLQEKKVAQAGRFTGFLSWALGIDASSLSASNATQRLFFSLVHMYLLLLLIASFPAQWTTRTKLVVTQRASPPSSHTVSESDNSDSDDSAEGSVERRDAPTTPRNDIHLKKRLFAL